MQVADTSQRRQLESVEHTLHEFRASRRSISDVRDGQGNQYVDLVMEGGGVLGIALVGYTHALEQAGVRFRSIGGTSAGAINALLLAALGPPGAPKSPQLLRVLAQLEMFKFVDGGPSARWFVRGLIRRRGLSAMLPRAIAVARQAIRRLGLNPGDAFEAWLARQLRLAGINTTADLLAKMREFPPGMQIDDARKLTLNDLPPRLAIVAADLSTESKIVFPEMAELYFEDPAAVNPARFVRASMSVPGFFEPLRIRPIARPADVKARWMQHTGYEGPTPDEAVFVDGGIMSNFPISLFHVRGEPLMPTFGVKLGIDRSEKREVLQPGQLVGAMFDAARHCLDFDFLHRNPDYRQLMTWIDTGAHHWLDFFMCEEAKMDLFLRGVEAGRSFIEKFDWEAYKQFRRGLAEAVRAARR